MTLFNFKKKSLTGISETIFECKRDGLAIRGTEYRPEGENLPVAIVSHGFMANRDSVRNYTKALASVGYAAYCFDFCGGCVMNGKSDGATTDMSVLTEVADLEAVIEYTKTLPYTSDELLLMGCSQGGFVSAITAARHPEAVSKLILIYPALCIPDDARKGQMMFAKFDPENIPETFMCGPMKLGRQYPADVLDMDPYDEIAGYHGPVMIIHGTKDNIVDLSYSVQANENYIRNSGAKNVVFKILEGAGHGFTGKHENEAADFVKEFAKLKER